MPLTGNFTPAAQPSEKPAGPAKYSPSRSGPGMVGNTAPIPGVEEPERPARAAAPANAAGPGSDQEPGEEGDGEGERRDDSAWRLSIVAKKESQARQLLKEAKEAQAQLKAAREEVAAERARIDEWKKQDVERRKSPRKVLLDYGYSPEAALQYELAGGKLTPEQQLAANLEQRLNETQEQVEQRLQKQSEQDEQRRQKEREEQEQQDRQALAEQEQMAVAELEADIGDILAGDAKSYGLLTAAEKRGAGRGIGAVYQHVQGMSDRIFQESGRRPAITTRMLERAAAEVEALARKELQETMADPELAAALGLQTRAAPVRAQQLTNRIPPAGARVQPQQVASENETAEQKRERVKAMIDDAFRRRGGRAG